MSMYTQLMIKVRIWIHLYQINVNLLNTNAIVYKSCSLYKYELTYVNIYLYF